MLCVNNPPPPHVMNKTMMPGPEVASPSSASLAQDAVRVRHLMLQQQQMQDNGALAAASVVGAQAPNGGNANNNKSKDQQQPLAPARGRRSSLHQPHLGKRTSAASLANSRRGSMPIMFDAGFAAILEESSLAGAPSQELEAPPTTVLEEEEEEEEEDDQQEREYQGAQGEQDQKYLDSLRLSTVTLHASNTTSATMNRMYPRRSITHARRASGVRRGSLASGMRRGSLVSSPKGAVAGSPTARRASVASSKFAGEESVTESSEGISSMPSMRRYSRRFTYTSSSSPQEADSLPSMRPYKNYYPKGARRISCTSTLTPSTWGDKAEIHPILDEHSVDERWGTGRTCKAGAPLPIRSGMYEVYQHHQQQQQLQLQNNQHHHHVHDDSEDILYVDMRTNQHQRCHRGSVLSHYTEISCLTDLNSYCPYGAGDDFDDCSTIAMDDPVISNAIAAAAAKFSGGGGGGPPSTRDASVIAPAFKDGHHNINHPDEMMRSSSTMMPRLPHRRMTQLIGLPTSIQVSEHSSGDDRHHHDDESTLAFELEHDMYSHCSDDSDLSEFDDDDDDHHNATTQEEEDSTIYTGTESQEEALQQGLQANERSGASENQPNQDNTPALRRSSVNNSSALFLPEESGPHISELGSAGESSETFMSSSIMNVLSVSTAGGDDDNVSINHHESCSSQTMGNDHLDQQLQDDDNNNQSCRTFATLNNQSCKTFATLNNQSCKTFATLNQSCQTFATLNNQSCQTFATFNPNLHLNIQGPVMEISEHDDDAAEDGVPVQGQHHDDHDDESTVELHLDHDNYSVGAASLVIDPKAAGNHNDAPVPQRIAR